MKPLAWDDRALSDLEAITDYIARDNPHAARRVIEYIKRAATLLETSPRLGRIVEPNLHEFVLTKYPYILVYENAPDEVRILAVFHHRQQRR